LQAGLRADMRKLRADHITWTQLFVIAAEAGSSDADETAGRLCRTRQTSATPSSRCTARPACTLIDAAKAGDNAKVSSTKTALYANGDQIAAFLTKANPTSWPAAEMRQMMRDHLDTPSLRP
jgi:hypothetical protein